MSEVKYDYSKLRGKIKEKYGVQSVFAKDLGISHVSLSARLNNKIGWNQTEMLRSCDLLDIPDEELRSYFFARQVQLTEQRTN